MPQLWVIAGPNGAGKTTIANRWLANRIGAAPLKPFLPDFSGSSPKFAVNSLRSVH